MFKLRVVTQFIRRFIVSVIVMSIINIFIIVFFVFSQANQTNVMDTVSSLVEQLDISSNSAKLSNLGKKLANSKEVWIMVLDSDSGKEIYEYKKRMYLNVKFLIHPLFIYAKCCCKLQHLILRLLT